MASFHIWLCHWTGFKILEIPLGPGTRFEYVKAVNRTGNFTLELPYQLQERFLSLDNLVQFWRSPAGSLARDLDFLGWLRYWRIERKDDGSVATILKGHDPNGLLDRRIVAYDSDDAWTVDNDDPDVLIKNIFGQNFTSIATDPLRNLSYVNGLPSNYGADISISQPHRSFNLTNVQMRFAWMPVHEVFQKIHEMAFTNDPDPNKILTTYYGIRVRGVEASGYQRPHLRFELNYGHWGQNRTWAANKPNSILFNNANGNLINEFYEEDHRNEANVVYAGGIGRGALREVAYVTDPARYNKSGWARAEAFVDARQQETTAQTTSAGYAKLAEMRPRIIAGGDLIDTDYARYGRDWYHGDKVTIEVFGTKYDGVIMSTSYRLEEGEETITSRVLHEST